MRHQKPNRLLKKLKARPTLFIGVLFVLIAIIIAFLGQFSRYEQPSAKTIFNDFYTNITTDLIAIAVTVLIIDTLNQRRAALERKRRLIGDLRNPNNGIALSSLNELRDEGWAEDGALCNAYLKDANLEYAYLRAVDLSGAWLRDANLQRAYMKDAKLNGTGLIGVDLTGARELTPAQLSKARCLLGAILPDGSRYDGRFNLSHDIQLAKERGYDLNNPEEAARFYGITPARYLENHRSDPNSEIAITTGIYKREDWLERYLNPDPNPLDSLAKEPSATTAD